ncbi:hypothetical protein AADZ91_18290 [Colwelliaceae bacterium 6441]
MKKINTIKIAPLFIILSMFNTLSSNANLIEDEIIKEKKEDDVTKKESNTENNKFSLFDICKDYPYCKMMPAKEDTNKNGN